MAPISVLDISPARHNMGSNQRGSAPFLSPTDSENQTPSLKSSRDCFGLRSMERSRTRAPGLVGDQSLVCSGGGASCNSSGAVRPAEFCRKNAAAIISGVWRARISSTKGLSSSLIASLKAGSAKIRSRSRARISSTLGARAQVARTLAFSNKRSVFLRALLGTIRTLTPLRPARPVRPLRCNRPSAFFGTSA